MSSAKVIRVSPESDRHIREYATLKGITVSEAADRLVATAVGRRAALARFAETHTRKAPAKKAAKRKAKRIKADAPSTQS
jgi:hypothetical protein